MRGLPRMASICGDLSGCPVLRIELSCFLCGCTSKRPLSVVKRTFGSAAAMSANDPNRTSYRRRGAVEKNQSGESTP